MESDLSTCAMGAELRASVVEKVPAEPPHRAVPRCHFGRLRVTDPPGGSHRHGGRNSIWFAKIQSAHAAQHRDNEQISGVLAFRVESPIVYFNVDHVLRIVLHRVEAEAKSLRLIVCDLSTSPTVDLAGARMFLDLYTEIAKRRMILRLVEAHAPVRDLLRIEGAEDRVGRIDRFATVDDVIEHFQKEGG
jgi:MFS superfamily sulfate permease-like transporter